MNKAEKAAAIMEAWARDDSHGYDQAHRWGERGDYDCSAAVISAYELAGVPVKTGGATYTGNMRGVFLRCGFADVPRDVDLNTGRGLRRGDVLLNYQHHTAVYCGDGREVEASINELGTVTGGQPGDQTGREFLIRPYRNYPWDAVLRYTGAEDAGDELPTPAATEAPRPYHGTCTARLPVLAKGDEGPAVAALQGALHYAKYALGAGGVDGDFGAGTDAAVRNYQTANGLEVDGEVGPATWGKLMN